MKDILIFSLGVGVGSLVTWKLLEKKYKDIADEEINSVIETFKNRNKEENVEKQEVIEKDEFDGDVREYSKIADNYTIQIEDQDDHTAPYVIAPEEFSYMDDYETKSWTFWSDSVLTDENDDIVYDQESIIGDALTHFGEYEDDSVYVRNEYTKCDYEILKSEKSFSEFINGEDR